MKPTTAWHDRLATLLKRSITLLRGDLSDLGANRYEGARGKIQYGVQSACVSIRHDIINMSIPDLLRTRDALRALYDSQEVQWEAFRKAGYVKMDLSARAVLDGLALMRLEDTYRVVSLELEGRQAQVDAMASAIPHVA